MRSLNLLLAVSYISTFPFAAAQLGSLTEAYVDSLFKKLQQPGNCDAAQEVVGWLKLAAVFGDTFFVSTVKSICNKAKGSDKDVCEGTIKLEAPTIADRLRSISKGSDTAKLLAATSFGQCAYPAFAPYKIDFPKPKPKAPRPAPSGQTPIQIVQYSDIHVDPFYAEGSNYNCDKPLCCRNDKPSNAPGNTKFPAGPFGEVKCDSPLSLEQSMYKAIGDLAPDARFTLFTGDIVDHHLWNTTLVQNSQDIKDAYNRMNDSFQLVYGTAGNHEAHPTNLFQPSSKGKTTAWLYGLLSSAWGRWTEGPAATATKSGFYGSTYPHGKLRIISLNTNFYYNLNWWMYQEPLINDPDDQFKWLVNELQAAEDASVRAYIIGHTPMGAPDAFQSYSHTFDQIINRYENTIAALFFGHTHEDEFEIGYRNYNQRGFSTASAISYICPSMMPDGGNPAFRVYSVDPVTFAVLDSITYFADMKDPDYQKGPVWKKLYSAKESYGPLVSPQPGPNDELSPAFWHNVTDAFELDHNNLNTYLKYKSRGYNDESCTGACAANEICQIRSMRSQDNCYVPKPGINIFSKRDLDKRDSDSDMEMDHHDDCGMSVTTMTLGEIVHDRHCFDILVHAINGTTNGTAQGNSTAPSNSTANVNVQRAVLKPRGDDLLSGVAWMFGL